MSSVRVLSQVVSSFLAVAVVVLIVVGFSSLEVPAVHEPSLPRLAVEVFLPYFTDPTHCHVFLL